VICARDEGNYVRQGLIQFTHLQGPSDLTPDYVARLHRALRELTNEQADLSQAGASDLAGWVQGEINVLHDQLGPSPQELSNNEIDMDVALHHLLDSATADKAPGCSPDVWHGPGFHI
jgi:hypothetical protein